MEDGTMESKAFEGCLSREVVALWQSQVRSFELPFVLRQRRKIRDVEMQRLIEEKSYMLQCLLHDATPKDILEMNKKFSSLALEIRFDPVATDRRRCHGDAEFLLRYPFPNKTTVPRRLKKGLAPSIYRHALRSVQEQDPRPQDLVSIPLPEALLADIRAFCATNFKGRKGRRSELGHPEQQHSSENPADGDESRKRSAGVDISNGENGEPPKKYGQCTCCVTPNAHLDRDFPPSLSNEDAKGNSKLGSRGQSMDQCTKGCTPSGQKSASETPGNQREEKKVPARATKHQSGRKPKIDRCAVQGCKAVFTRPVQNKVKGGTNRQGEIKQHFLQSHGHMELPAGTVVRVTGMKLLFEEVVSNPDASDEFGFIANEVTLPSEYRSIKDIKDQKELKAELEKAFKHFST
jgi:hypothetical protein